MAVDKSLIILSRNIPAILESNSLPHGWTCASNGSVYGEPNFQWVVPQDIPLLDCPVFLIIDHTSSHLSLHVLENAKGDNITIISLPAKTSHLLQPVDQIVSMLKECFSNEVYKLSLVKALFLAQPQSVDIFYPVLQDWYL